MLYSCAFAKKTFVLLKDDAEETSYQWPRPWPRQIGISDSIYLASSNLITVVNVTISQRLYHACTARVLRS